MTNRFTTQNVSVSYLLGRQERWFRNVLPANTTFAGNVHESQPSRSWIPHRRLFDFVLIVQRCRQSVLDPRLRCTPFLCLFYLPATRDFTSVLFLLVYGSSRPTSENSCHSVVFQASVPVLSRGWETLYLIRRAL